MFYFAEITVPEEAKQNISLDSGKKKKQNSVPQVTEVEQNNDNEGMEYDYNRTYLCHTISEIYY